MARHPTRTTDLAASREAKALRRALLRWYDTHKRDLPWRNVRDPYAIWVSEVMLQQTQVQTVIPYWTQFLQRFPTVAALAHAELPEVLAHWRGLGYYARARCLHRAAGLVVERHGGELPRSLEALRELPGFGPYTSGAVASIAFDLPAPLVDGNVARVLSRLFLVEGRPQEKAREKRLWALAETLVQGERPGAFNQALMELGATLCRAESPRCQGCPVRAQCGAHAQDRTTELPWPKLRAPKKTLQCAVAVVRDGERVLLGRRHEKGLFGGLWELPKVELAAAGTDEPDQHRALGLLLAGASVGPSLGQVRRELTHRQLVLDLWTVELARRVRALEGYAEVRYVTFDEAGKLGMSTAMAQAMAQLPIHRTAGVSKRRRRRSSVSFAEP